MNPNKPLDPTDTPEKRNPQGFDMDQPDNPGARPKRQRSEAGDQVVRRRPDSEPAIPELPEPDVEGVGNEGRDTKVPQGHGP